MPATIDDLQKSLQDILTAVKGGGGGTGTPTNSPQPKTVGAFDELNSRIKAVAASFLSVGAVLRGLQGTREGARLDFAMQRIFFEIADSLREPIRLITRELNGLANVMHDVNHSTDVVHLRYYNKAAVEARAGRPEGSDHLQPMFKASFGDVAGLQAKFQALTLENPTEEKGMSIIEAIYRKLCDIANKLGAPSGTVEGAITGAGLPALQFLRDM